ncbi:MAG: TRAP transporter substrate-binding protein DctP [Thermodesulfobacteriota bacterium]
MDQRKRKLFPVMLVLLLAAAVCVPWGSTAAAKPIELRVAYYSPDNHPLTVAAKEVLADIDKLTMGRVKMKMFASHSLLPTKEMATGVNEGTAFCANWYLPYMSKTIPLFNIETLPVWTSGHYKAVIDAYENGLNDLYTQALQRQGLKNLKVAGVSMCLWRVLTTKKKLVKVPADAKGLKIRSVGAEADMWRSFGASPVNITTPQTYEALARGVADGATNYLETMMDRKWLEHTDYVTCINLSPVLMHIIYNYKMLDKLSPQDKVIVENGMKRLAQITRLHILEGEGYAFAVIPRKFNTVIYVPTAKEHQEWVKACQPLVAAFTKSKDPLIQQAMKIVHKYNP